MEQALATKQAAKNAAHTEFNHQKQGAIENVWKIKREFAGGDRVLEYCLDGLKGQKEKLFEHLQGISLPENEPTRTIDDVKTDVAALKGGDAAHQLHLTELVFEAHAVESHDLLGTAILGNTDSEVSALIEELDNADWVKQGIEYLPVGDTDIKGKCPFCQESTITTAFIERLKSYFDASYQTQLEVLEKLLRHYQCAIETLPNVNQYLSCPFAQARKDTLSDKHKLLTTALDENFQALKAKHESPKLLISLLDTSSMVSAFNIEIVAINKEIEEFNNRLMNREQALKSLKAEFWSLMRWKYDQTMSRFAQDRLKADHKFSELDGEIANLNSEIAKAKGQIAEAQKQTINVDAAVMAINVGLLEFGIDEFSVQKHSDNLYRVVRPGGSSDAFRTLSEGEKMIISFLYFCELCKGKASVEDTHSQRIVVIDDPISSLSHVYVFNVGQMIRSLFFRNDRYSQVFVLTHSLYFFYELTDTNHERREVRQKLFRLSKPTTGSVIENMKYEEVQNDYQAYWSVVNDSSQPEALIANCMRNIVEYFFNFVRKTDLNNVFQMSALQDNKFQAFCRYVNRESHSLGQNIFDLKEFDYGVFKEGLRLVFDAEGYSEHYEAMSEV